MSTMTEQPVTTNPEAPAEGGRSPWWWVPTLYFAEGIPYVLVNVVSVVMFAKMGVSNARIALWTSILSLPWVVKPLWGPLVDLYWTKRKWVLLMQFLLAGSFAAVALALQGKSEAIWWWGSVAALGIAAILSATHDIAADGYYMVALSERKQALFVGIRSTFYRVAMITGQGVLVIIAGLILAKTGPEPVVLEMSAVPKGQALVAPPEAKISPDAFLRYDPPVVTLEGGTTVPVAITLAQQPETTQVVTINRKYSSFFSAFFPVGAEQLIKVSKGERLEFGPENWNEPQIVVAEADEKLKEPATARFEAAAGDVDLTWTYCFAGMAGIFLLIGMFHTAAMPRAALDGTVTGTAGIAGFEEQRPPFLRALGGVLAMVAVPIAVYVALFFGIRWGIQQAPTLSSLGWFNSLSTFIINALVILFFWLVFQSHQARRTFMAGFQGASRMAGIPFADVFIEFFRKPGIGRMVAFLLLYRLGEALLVKMSGPFLLKPRSTGGLGLTQAEYGLAYGTVGVLTMTIGGILGGLVVARHGLKRWFLPMCVAINLPDALYVYMAWAQPEDFRVILACVATETFGYGFGFAAYMLYMLYIAGEGEHKTSHFAITTGFMALGMMIPGMVSGFIQEATGYVLFFTIVCIATLPGFLMLPIIPLDPEFGRRGSKS